MKVASATGFTSALILSACAAVFAQEQPDVSEAPPSQPSSLSGAAASRNAAQSQLRPTAGLLNDWLRKQNPENYNWDLGGQVRGRYEFKDHMAIDGVPGSVDFLGQGADTSNSYELLRSKVHLGYIQNPGARYYIEARDSRSWGDQRSPRPEDDLFDLHQAYAVFGDMSRFPATLKVGRQELSYGDERLIGSSDWSNLGRVFDAAKFHYQGNGYWMDVFVGRVVLVDDGSLNQWNDYDTLAGIYASSATMVGKQETHAYILFRNTTGNSPTANSGGSPQSGGPSARDIITVGVRVRSVPGELGGWDYETEFARQFGTINQGAGRVNQEAYAAHIASSYTWRDAYSSPRVGLEYNFSTGDASRSDGKSQTFDNLFPTNHRLYGVMDFFSWQNVHNVRLNFTCKPLKGLTLALDGHAFWLADTSDSFYTASGALRGPAAPTPGGGYGINPSYDNYVGSELDFVATYEPTSWANLQAGYGHFFTGSYVNKSLKGVGGAKEADFFYAQLKFTF